MFPAGQPHWGSTVVQGHRGAVRAVGGIILSAAFRYFMTNLSHLKKTSVLTLILYFSPQRNELGKMFTFYFDIYVYITGYCSFWLKCLADH